MKLNMHLLVSTAFCLGVACCAQGQDSSSTPDKSSDQQIARIRKILSESVIETQEVKETSPAESLKALEAALPKDKKMTLRFDEKAFGKDFSQIASVKFNVPRSKMSLRQALVNILSRLPKELEAEYGIEPNGIVITRASLLGHSVTYSLRGLLKEVPALFSEQQFQKLENFRDLEATDALGLLVRFLMNNVDLRSWESIRVMNGVRLVVFASPFKQEEIGDLLVYLRRQCDLNVVMNARLYEVDRAFYIKHIAPLVAADKPSEEPGGIVSIDGPLFKRIARQKFLLESEDVKIRPTRKEIFISHQDAVRFTAGPKQGKEERAPLGTALPGVSFEVRPVLSMDRRFLRLHISQHVIHLVGIGKIKIVDPATGKDVEVESPNLRKTTESGTVQVPDGGAIVMPVTYRPQGKEYENKVWLLVARPYIWIQEEVDVIRKGGGDLSSKEIWESDVPNDTEAAPVKPLKRLPDNDEVREILQALVTDVLTNPQLKDTREFYGTAKDRTVGIVDNEKLGWPRHFKPETPGHKLVEVRRDPFEDGRRILGITIHKFDLKQKKADILDTPIEISLFNAGGSANGAVIGGCIVYYVPKLVGKRWTVEYQGSLDP